MAEATGTRERTPHALPHRHRAGAVVVDNAPAGGQAPVCAPPAVGGDLAAYARLLEGVGGGQRVDPECSRLVDDAVAVWARPGFEVFVSLPRLRFEPFDYQLRAAGRVLRQMRGRAILADEVGLGKTIEACLVASELRLRGLASRTLVVAPAGLVGQWQEELERKFGLPSQVAAGGWRPGDGAEPPVVVTSLAAARRKPLRDTLAAQEWDLVIVDEAHRVRRPRSASGRLARTLRSRYLLLLSATPVENRLADLYELCTLVRPGHLGTPKDFRARHGTGLGARDLPALRTRVREVMVRHRRSEVALMLPPRLATTRRVTPAGDEAALYAAVSQRVREHGRGASPQQALQLRAVQRLAGSSPRALAATLERVGWADLAADARRVGVTAKAAALVDVLGRCRQRGEKAVVFSGYRQTVAFLAPLLAEAGLDTVVYHGGLTRRDKDAVVEAFRDDAAVLLSTEAAGEGRNLQFCHVMVNFDLPWNPLALEQRLGRLHRIGQTEEVRLTNLATAGTIEDRILRVLEAKVHLFELVVGELDMILGRIDDDFDFEQAVFAAHVASADDGELDARLHALGDELARARHEHLATREGVDVLTGGEGEA